MTLSIMTKCFFAVSFMLSVAYVECHFQAFYADCHYAECRYAECRGATHLYEFRGHCYKTFFVRDL